MPTGKVFMSGNSQAVRLPKEFRFDTAEVDIERSGDTLILSPRRSYDARRFLELLKELPDDMFDNKRDDRPPQERDFS